VKKITTTLFSYIFAPACLTGYAFTHHGGFLFIYGLANFLAIVMYLFLIPMTFVLATSDESRFNEMIIASNKTSKFRYYVSAVYLTGGFGYMVYIEHFFLAILVLLTAFLLLIFTSIVKHEYKKVIANASKEDLQKWLEAEKA
jgi:hypothetical protein